MPRRPQPHSSSPAYFIVGGDSYQRSLLREEVIAAVVPPDSRSLAVSQYSLEETPLDDVLGRARMPSLFSPRQVLVVRGVEQIEDSQLAGLEGYLDAPAHFTTLVFEADKLDRRTRVARLLLERCQVLAAEAPDDRGALEATQQFARQTGLRLSPEAAEELVFLLGPDQGRLRRELEKLRAYVGAGGQVTPGDVAAVVSPARQFTVFELADLLAEGRRGDVLVCLRRLLEAGESPMGIVGLLGWLYRQLWQARAFPPGTPAWKAAQTLRAPRTRVESLLRQARRFHPEELRGAFAALLEADVTLKSSPPDPAAVLEVMVMRLTPSRGAAEVERP